MESEIANEYEAIGMAALVGMVLLPGIFWISKAKGAGSTLLRTVVVGSLLLGAVTVEASMDQVADSL